MSSNKSALVGALICAASAVVICLAVPAGLPLALAAVLFALGLVLSMVAAGSALKVDVSQSQRVVAWALVTAYVGAAIWLGVLLSSVPFG